jgi:hypothetical protein
MPVAVSSAGRSLAVVLVAAIANCGCQSWLFARAVASVKTALPPDSPVLSRLRTTSNPRGSGIVVYVPSTAACGPEVLWVADHETYALDARSQALTPDLRRFDEASAGALHSMGADTADFAPALRQFVCEVERRRSGAASQALRR